MTHPPDLEISCFVWALINSPWPLRFLSIRWHVQQWKPPDFVVCHGLVDKPPVCYREPEVMLRALKWQDKDMISVWGVAPAPRDWSSRALPQSEIWKLCDHVEWDPWKPADEPRVLLVNMSSVSSAFVVRGLGTSPAISIKSRLFDWVLIFPNINVFSLHGSFAGV